MAMAEVNGPVEAPFEGLLEAEFPETASLLSKLTKLVVEAFSKEGAALEDCT
jgi:hypothetical protein